MHCLIAVTYALAAGVAGVAMVRAAGLDPGLSAAIAVALGLTAGQIHALTARLNNAAMLLAEIERVKAAMQRVKETQADLMVQFRSVEEALDRQIVRRNEQILGQVRVLEDMLERMMRSADSHRRASQTAPAVTTSSPDANALIGVLRRALERNQIELHLQPVVMLPQRRTVFYEGYSRIRDPAGRLILPGDFLKTAETYGLLGDIDNLVMLRCVQIMRRLVQRDRRIGVFCNVSLRALGDGAFFPQFFDYLRDNVDLAGALILEVSQESFDTRTPEQARNMARLQDLGFRFSIDRATRLDVDLPELQKAGVRFFKIAGIRLAEDLVMSGVRPVSGVTREIEPRDVAALFARHGIDLIADRIEDERIVVEILDLDIAYGQGNLFGPPKPIKDDLADAAEAKQALTRAARP
jgi:cyclic-di-GMP phosphodiesterase TipF (flagellum assembly factor)